MHLAKYSRRLRRGAAFLGLAVLLGACTMALSQCRLVGDSLTGVSPNARNPNNCFAQCAAAFNDSIRLESQRHTAAVQACGNDAVCHALEDAFHDAAVDRIQAGREQCQINCHHQGAGGGGL